MEILEKLDRPKYFYIVGNRKSGVLFLVFKDDISARTDLISRRRYNNGMWKGIHVHGGEYGHSFCVEMSVRHTLDLLEIVPEIDVEHKVIALPIDEVKRSNAPVVYSEFLLPLWKQDELWEYKDEEE